MKKTRALPTMARLLSVATLLVLLPMPSARAAPDDERIWSLDGSLELKVRRGDRVLVDVSSAILRFDATGSETSGGCVLEGYDGTDALEWSLGCTWSMRGRKYRFEPDGADAADLVESLVEEAVGLPATIEVRKIRGRGKAGISVKRSMSVKVKGRVEIGAKVRRFKATFVAEGCLGAAPCPDRGSGNGSGGGGGADPG